MSDIFQVPAYITEVKATANGSLKIKAETMESLSGDAMQRFFAQIDKPGYLCFAARQIETTDLLDIPMPKSDKKTKSQKLRARPKNSSSAPCGNRAWARRKST